MIDKLSLCISDCIVCIILNCESLNSYFESEYREPSLAAISSNDGIKDFLFDLFFIKPPICETNSFLIERALASNILYSKFIELK